MQSHSQLLVLIDQTLSAQVVEDQEEVLVLEILATHQILSILMPRLLEGRALIPMILMLDPLGNCDPSSSPPPS